MGRAGGVRWDVPVRAVAGARWDAPAPGLPRFGVRWDFRAANAGVRWDFAALTAGVRWDAPVALRAAGVRWDAPAPARAVGVRWDVPAPARAAGVRWDAPGPRLFAALLLVATLVATLLAPAAGVGAAREAANDLVSVIVRAVPGAMAAAEDAVTSLGGTVVHRLGALETVTAEVPQRSLDAVRRARSVRQVSPDARLRMHSSGSDAAGLGSAANVSAMTRSRKAWARGLTGKGVGVALIDTGIVHVAGLRSGDIYTGPDLSPEGQFPAVHGLDTFGHGTHMAGLIAGGTGAMVRGGSVRATTHVGTAPDATLLSVKVAGSDGATDVSQVLAAINWVIEHRNDKAMNIRVLNLSFGTDGTQDYRRDPLTYAAEVAWRKGIVVVAAAGNGGAKGALTNPAYDPHIIAVGASDPRGTVSVADDRVASFSSGGDGRRRPDLVAPGRSVVSYRNPNSAVDTANPQGRVGGRLFKGSGTSQAAAIVAGSAALLLQQRPGLTPDQVKRLLMGTARPLKGDRLTQGAGLIDVAAALDAPTPSRKRQPFPWATGTGSLDAARGSARLADVQGNVLTGEVDVQGGSWDGNSWSAKTWAGNSWSGGEWNGNSWSGNSWSGNSWSGNSWSGNSWSGNSWSGNSWSGDTWSSASWA